ncbi:MAG: hypothetical protein ACLU6Y_08720 [Ruminococcus sp.]
MRQRRNSAEGCAQIQSSRNFLRMEVNNWYYAYGDSSEEEILSDTDYILKLTEGVKNPPFMVIDDCWQEHHSS